MKNHWVTFIGGKIHVKVDGNGVERFINQLTRSQLTIWNVKRQGTSAITFYIRLQDIHKLRHQARKFQCHVSFLSGQGAPFLWKRTLKNGGFLAGLLIFFAIITILSNVVWGINIKGASPQTEHQIRKELEDLGVKVGKLQFFIDDVETIQRKLTKSLPNITWVGVDLSGTTYHFQVVEKNTPLPLEKLSPRHLVANQKAVIVDMFVENGQPNVKVNQYVKKGQLLVSGIIGNEKSSKKVAAKGIVLGKTWYKSEVTMPLKSDFKVFTGKEKRKHYLKFGKITIPLWGFGKTNYEQFKVEDEARQIKFLKWNLPIKYSEKTIREESNVEREYTKNEATDAAKKLARSDLKAKIPSDAKIVDEYILQENVENGKVNLVIYFQVIEDIAIAKPILQGD